MSPPLASCRASTLGSSRGGLLYAGTGAGLVLFRAAQRAAWSLGNGQRQDVRLQHTLKRRGASEDHARHL